jgi:GNAT acetyltransferase-like protein
MGDLLDGPRACRDYELPPLLDVINQVFRVDAGRPPDMGHCWAHVYRPANLDNVRLIKINHQIASCIAIYPTRVQAGAATLQVGGINAVTTLPAFRRRGLAGQVLRDCHAKMLRDGCDIGLLSTPVTEWYRRFDWESGGSQRAYTLDRASIAYLPEPADITIDDAAERHLAAIRALYAAGPFAAARDLDTCRILLLRPGYRTYVALQAGQATAYMVLRGAGTVVEYGGPAPAVAGLIRAVFLRLDDPTISTSTRSGAAPMTPLWEVQTPPGGDGLAHWFEELGLPFRQGYLGMLRVINARQLLGKVAPAIAVEAETDAGITLRHGRERVTLSRRELVKLIFGPERIAAFARDVMPTPFFQWTLDRM